MWAGRARGDRANLWAMFQSQSSSGVNGGDKLIVSLTRGKHLWIFRGPRLMLQEVWSDFVDFDWFCTWIFPSVLYALWTVSRFFRILCMPTDRTLGREGFFWVVGKWDHRKFLSLSQTVGQNRALAHAYALRLNIGFWRPIVQTLDWTSGFFHEFWYTLWRDIEAILSHFCPPPNWTFCSISLGPICRHGVMSTLR